MDYGADRLPATGTRPTLTPPPPQESFIDKEIERIRTLVGPKGQVIGAVSGGVDSSVAAKLMHEAIGDRSVPHDFFLSDVS